MDDSAKRLSELLGQFFNKEYAASVEGFGKLTSAWQAIAGPGLCDHSRIADIRNKSVVVYVDHPGWLQKLQFREGQMLSQIQREYPELGVQSLFFRVVSHEKMIGSVVELDRHRLQEEFAARKRAKHEALLQAEAEGGPEIPSEKSVTGSASSTGGKEADPEFKKALERFRQAARQRGRE